MPQIRRIRIVNISYNNGKRLIPDELFDLTDENGSAGLNTLISLINGGGKSVLVQLMMQPVLPRAHASSRKIEDYFTHARDHGYILLEWALDNSSTRLLTGIAIAAAESSDESRGRNIKYYTFCTTYTQDSAKYGIINLELSQAEGNRFVSAEFDFIRKLANRSNGELRYYSDRDSVAWKEKLEEYGIFQEQWRTLTEKLNASENGMTGYFEKFKTSDQLIDGLLIPAIEAHLSQTDTSGESTLSAMMLGYLEQYRSNEKRVQEREVCRRFTDAMTERRKAVQELWKTDDAHNHAVADLFGFQAALAEKLAELKEYAANLEQQQTAAENALRRVKWEEASERFWKAKKAAEQSSDAYRQAQAAASNCAQSIELQRQKSKRMQSAKYAAKYHAAEIESDAITAQIRDKEQDSDAKQLTVLGASVRRILETALPAQQDIVRQQQDAKSAAQAALQDAKSKLVAAEKAAQNAQQVCAEAKGGLAQYKLETDGQVQNLHLDMQRNFIDCYSADELQKIADGKAADLQELETEKVQHTAAQETATARAALIPQEIADITIRQHECESLLASLRDEKTDYYAAEEHLRQIFALHSLDFSQRFTPAAADYLAGKLHEAESELRRAERLLEQKSEELRAANAGTLHIPKTVLNWLQQIGVQYQTCERYLLDSELSAEQTETVLRNCPALAYGILVDESEIDLLVDQRPDWLPSVLPIFTYSDMQAILCGTFPEHNLLGYYAQRYFTDHDGFVAFLQKEQDEISRQISSIKDRIARLKNECETVSAFQYDENWLSRKAQEIGEQEDTNEALNRESAALTQEADNLIEQQNTLRKQISEAEHAITDLRQLLDLMEDLQSRIIQEDRLFEAYESAKKAASDREKEKKNAAQTAESAQQALDAAESALQLSENLLTEMQQAQTTVQNYTGDTISGGDWQELYQQFQKLCEIQDESVKMLRIRLDAVQKDMKEARAELRRIGCQPEEYADTVYTESAEAAIADELDRLEALQKKLHQEETDCAKTEGETRAAFNQANRDLEQFGEPLDPSQIGSDYQNRKSAAQAQIDELKAKRVQTNSQYDRFDRLFGRADDALRGIKKPDTVLSVHLETDAPVQWKQLCHAESELQKQLTEQHRVLQQALSDLLTAFENEAQEKAIKGMLDLMQQNSIQGDRYYTLDERISSAIKATELRAEQIDAELNDFDNTKQDLVHQCVLQGQQIYQALQTLMKNSRVQAYEDTRKEMLKMDLPREIDEKLAADEIAAEIERSAQEIIHRLERGEMTEAELKQKAEETVSSRHLLRKYIRKESIELQAYKVDANCSHAEYRRWKEIPRTNSGAEKFLVYFAVIVLLMDYSGSDAGVRTHQNTDVLILDNPFAVITSAHVLKPMFRMADQFHIQLICLSDITKCDITNCFDLHIKAAVRQSTLSEIGILSHEGNEQIEHGFYRAAQYSLS